MHAKKSNAFSRTLFAAATVGWLTAGCFSFGPSRTENKSHHYEMAKLPPPWEKVSAGPADTAYQYPGGEATITVNSVCREYSDQTLEALTKQLLIGISDPVILNQAPFERKKGQNPGLQTWLEGKMDALPFHMSTIVIRSHDCIYDFSLITKPHLFEKHVITFMMFVRSFDD